MQLLSHELLDVLLHVGLGMQQFYSMSYSGEVSHNLGMQRCLFKGRLLSHSQHDSSGTSEQDLYYVGGVELRGAIVAKVPAAAKAQD